MEQTSSLLKNNKYRILNILNKGGFGTVYKAFDNELSQIVAIKELLPDQMENPLAVQLFHQEAQIMLSLRHKNIVLCEDFFQEGNRFFIVMEFIEGGSLADRIDSMDDSTRAEVGRSSSNSHRPRNYGQSTCFSVPTIAEIVCQICDGLVQPHQYGIFHCDLKPGNLLLSKDGLIKIADFGIANIRREFNRNSDGNRILTVDYASPEQIQGPEVDQRSDIYSLGIIMYELAIGHKPFTCDASSDTDWQKSIITQQLSLRPQPPSLLKTDISPAFETIILKSLEKAPDDRFDSVGNLKQEILPFLQPDGLVGLFPIASVSQIPISKSGNAVCKYCGTKIENVVTGTFLCGACSNPLLIEDCQKEAALYDANIDEKLQELGCSVSEVFTSGVREENFQKFLLERWLKYEEQQLDRDFSLITQKGVFDFPRQYTDDAIGTEENRIISLVKRINFLLYCWQSKQVNAFIFSLKSKAIQDSSQKNLRGKAYFLLGIFQTIRGRNLSGDYQISKYRIAQNWFENSEQAFIKVNPQFATTAHNCIQLCSLAENFQESTEAVQKSLIDIISRFRTGNSWDETTADQIELLHGGRIEQKPIINLPWFRKTKFEKTITSNNFSIDIIKIPDGKFRMGAKKSAHQSDTLRYEQSISFDGDDILVPEFFMGKYPVTIGQFSIFTLEEGYQTSVESTGGGRVFRGNSWEKSTDASWKNPSGQINSLPQQSFHPVTHVSFRDAIKFCTWLSNKIGFYCTLPSEAQWEKASRSNDQRIYPWGNEEPDQYRANYGCAINETKPIGYYSRGDLVQSSWIGGTKVVNQDSPYGCCDMAGNVWEWTRSLFKPYPYIATDGRENLEASGPRVIRGGAFDSTASELRTFTRRKMYPDQAYGNLGFRIVVLEK